MATTIKKSQIIQKISDTDSILLHPETSSDAVTYDGTASGLSANNVKAALDELKSGIGAISAGGLVTGIKGSAESVYRTGQVNLTKAHIGLSNVDNTSDAAKPISTAVQTALEAKLSKTEAASAYIPVSQKGTASGVATLGTDGKVPSSQLPSYVDDVLEYENLAGFPAAGETGKIYVAKDTNKTYRWSGTTYVEISASIALGETSSTAYAGDKGKANATAIAALQTSVSGANTAAGTAQSTANAAKTTAESAQSTADGAAANITKLTNGTISAGKATKLATARTISLAGDVTGSASFDGSTNASITATLKNSGVTAGTYTAVQVNAKGIVTGGAQAIEVGTAGQATPSASLANGGLFFKLIG